MTSEKFRIAVEWAKQAIQQERYVDGWDIATASGWESHLNERAGHLVRYNVTSGYPNVLFSDDPGEFSEERAKQNWDANVAELLSEVSTSRRAFEAAILGLASAIEEGAEIHPALRPFLAKVLRGHFRPPSQKAGRGESTGLHTIIVNLIADMAFAGWQPLRNDVSSPISACDVMAIALRELSLSPITYAGVKRIWTQRDREMVQFRFRQWRLWNKNPSG